MMLIDWGVLLRGTRLRKLILLDYGCIIHKLIRIIFCLAYPFGAPFEWSCPSCLHLLLLIPVAYDERAAASTCL